MSIYKPCDIRGHFCTEVTPQLYHNWGVSLGMQLEPSAKFVVGGDVRFSTPELMSALIEGLCKTGIDVVDLGCLPTPMIYYARRRLAADGCAVVTASHNPPDFNGLKWMLGARPPSKQDVRRLKQQAEKPPAVPKGRKPTQARALDVTFDYVAALQETWVNAREAALHVVVDPMYGCWAGRARRYLHAIFPPLMMATIHDEPDPVFGGHAPDCSRHERLEELAEAVYHERADLGIAFDGDGDRVAFVDDGGSVLTAEEATWVLLQTFGDALSGQPFVHDVKFSDRLPEAAAAMGAVPAAERSGHAFIRERMVQSGAPFGAEVSGHYFFGELGGGDDGLYAACRMIAHLAGSGRSLSSWRGECPAVMMTPDLRLPVPPRRQKALLDQVQAAWSDYPQSTLDGVRVDFPDGWALIRRSVTEPVVTCRFESKDFDKLARLVRRFCSKLPEMGEDLWEHFEDAMHAAG